jgi:serine/threonine protein kinase
MSILHNPTEFNNVVWKRISDLAKDLAANMLTKNPDDRITVEGALQHPWIQANREAKPKANRRTKHSLANLKKFQVDSKLK